MNANQPNDEAARLAALRSYQALGTPPEPCFDRLTRLTAQLLQTRFAALALIDENRGFIKSCYGAEPKDFPREHAFLKPENGSHEPLVVLDATRDQRFAQNPYVLAEPGIRFYAGAPLITPSGFCIGSLSAIDLAPRESVLPEQIALLRDLADEAMEQIEHRLDRQKLETYASALERRELEFRQALERCDKSEARAALALDAGEMAYWEWDAAADRITWSPRMAQIFGVSPDAHRTQQDWLSRIHPDDRKRVETEIAKNGEIGGRFTLRYRILRPDGTTAWIVDRGSEVLDPEGRLMGAFGVCFDSSEREKWLAELHSSEELFRGLSLSSPSGIFKANLDGNVTFANPKSCAIWDTDESEILGFGWINRVHPEDREALVTGWTAANAKRISFEHEYRLLFPDGQVRWVQGRSAIVHAEHGDAVVGTVIDITARKLTEVAMESAKAEAEAANRAKDLFLANVSHELRTPLNGILGMSELLLQGPLHESQREFAEVVQKSGKTLLTLVNDVLDTGKIGAGTLTIETAPFELKAALELALNYARRDAERKNLDLVLTVAEDLPSRLLGDGNRIQQIVLNFLTNAVKFTDAGRVECDVQCQSFDAAHCCLVIEVRDTGMGIPVEAQAKLFQPFSQVDNSTTRKQSGVGLGLSICRRLAELMGGSVGVKSAPGVGSTFWLKLHLPRATESSDQPPQLVSFVPKMASLGEEHGRVLVAEDNVINQRVVSRMLEKLGWEVDIAPDGLRAAALAQQNRYALVLMDCLMPEADGYTATTMIRDHERSHNLNRTPIVALTANALSGDRERCLQAGMDDYLSKPLQLHLLKEILQRWSLAPAGTH